MKKFELRLKQGKIGMLLVWNDEIGESPGNGENGLPQGKMLLTGPREPQQFISELSLVLRKPSGLVERQLIQPLSQRLLVRLDEGGENFIVERVLGKQVFPIEYQPLPFRILLAD